jgi:hypothetical protein
MKEDLNDRSWPKADLATPSLENPCTDFVNASTSSSPRSGRRLQAS